MKGEKLAAGIQAVWLSFLLTFGAMGCMITGLRLNAEHMGRLAALWAAVCLTTALLSNLRFGRWLLLAAAAWSAVFLLRNEQCLAQTLDLLCKVTRYFDNAYGWGVIASPQGGSGPMDRPLAVLGVWIAMVNCRALCRGNSGLIPLLTASLPLIASVVVTDTVPESSYLYVWLLSLTLILLSRGVRREQRRWGINVVRMAALPTALALGLLFWAVPRQGYDKHPDELQERVVQWFQELPDLWNQVSDEVAEKLDGTVQPESIRLDSLGRRINRVYPVMEVTAPTSGTVYLRGQHYDTYTGTGWEASEGQERFESPEDTRELGTITISTRAARDVIYLPYYPEERLDLVNGQIENPQREKSYSFTQRGLYTHWRNVVEERARTGSALYFHKTDTRYLSLPEETRAWAAELVDTILNGESTATAVADAIRDYVRGSARYDLDTQRMRRESGDFARWFLEESETGYCVHFATASVVLLRAAGVEARYVEGYMFSARMGKEITVTADQAHAWAEYYEPLLDTWVVLEATPPDLGGQPETEPPTEETAPPLPTQTEEPLPTQPETMPEQPQQEETRDIQTVPGDEAQEKTPDLSRLWNALLWVLASALAVLAVLGQRQLRLGWRENLRRKGSPNRRALFAWRELERLHRLLKSAPPEEARQVALKAKYSHHAISREELALLEQARRAALAQMNRRPWYLKLLDRYVFAVC